MRISLVLPALCACGLGAASTDPALIESRRQAVGDPVGNEGSCRSMAYDYEEETADGYTARYGGSWVCLIPPANASAACESVAMSGIFWFRDGRAFGGCRCVGWGQGSTKYFCSQAWWEPGPPDLEPPEN